jgi:hypothetical protein
MRNYLSFCNCFFIRKNLRFCICSFFVRKYLSHFVFFFFTQGMSLWTMTTTFFWGISVSRGVSFIRNWVPSQPWGHCCIWHQKSSVTKSSLVSLSYPLFILLLFFFFFIVFFFLFYLFFWFVLFYQAFLPCGYLVIGSDSV